MKEQAHTPGPWTARLLQETERTYCTILAAPGDIATIGSSRGMPGLEIEANALLIAQAPALLDLVKGVIELTDGTFTEVDILENLSRMGEEARALLGKVRGGGGQ